MLRRSEPGAVSEPSHTLGPHAARAAAAHPLAHATTPRIPIALLVKNYQYGGTQRVLLRLANKLSDYGYPVEVVCPGSGPLEKTLHDNVRRVHIEAGSRIHAR